MKMATMTKTLIAAAVAGFGLVALRWSYFVGQFGSKVKVYSRC